MDTMADISNLLTEFNERKSRIANAKDKYGLEKDINCLKIAWNSGNAGDAIKHATNFQRLAKKYKAKLSNAFWQTFESIASGDSVPQNMDSSTRPSSKYSRRESETAAASRGSTTKQPVKRESETAAARKGSTTEQPKKNKSQNEKESEQERAMDVPGIKFKAQQRQSEKNMLQKLQIIRNHIEDLAAATRHRPNDIKNSNSKSEDCNSLVEIILNQSAEVLNVYRQEKDRMTDTKERLREMFQHVTGREYKVSSILDGKGKEKNQYDTVEVLHQMISDIDKQLVDFTSDGMVSGRKANSDDRQQSAGMVPGRKAIIDQTHQREIEGHIQLDLIRQRLKPICAEVLNVDMDGMDTIQMIECLGKFLKKQNVRTKLDTSQDSEQRQFQLEREAWLKRINDTEDKLKEMVEQVTQLKKAAVGSKFK